MELPGIFNQGTDTKKMEPEIPQKCLLTIKGGYTVVDLAKCLISVVVERVNIKGIA